MLVGFLTSVKRAMFSVFEDEAIIKPLTYFSAELMTPFRIVNRTEFKEPIEQVLQNTPHTSGVSFHVALD